MTLEELTALVRRIDVSGFSIPLYLNTRPGCRGRSILRISMRVPDRDNAGEMIHVTREELLDMTYDEGFLIPLIRRMVQSLVLHELDEHIKIDGVRKWDPHQRDQG